MAIGLPTIVEIWGNQIEVVVPTYSGAQRYGCIISRYPYVGADSGQMMSTTTRRFYPGWHQGVGSAVDNYIWSVCWKKDSKGKWVKLSQSSSAKRVRTLGAVSVADSPEGFWTTPAQVYVFLDGAWRKGTIYVYNGRTWDISAATFGGV